MVWRPESRRTRCTVQFTNGRLNVTNKVIVRHVRKVSELIGFFGYLLVQPERANTTTRNEHVFR